MGYVCGMHVESTREYRAWIEGVLLAGGDKSTQARDIGKAMELSRRFREA